MSEYKDWPGYNKLKELAFEIAKDEGWTPPPDEPEFKAGDYVEVRSHNENWRLDRFIRLNSSDYPYDCERGAYLECRHAPTWIKWEDGQAPVPSGTKGTVFSNTSRPYIKMYDGRWAWMPE